VARGNVVLADHGQTLPAETLPPVVPGALYLPVLARSPVTQQGRVLSGQGALVPFDPQAPASSAFAYPMINVRPAIGLSETTLAGSSTFTWNVQRDLLGSGPLATDFVVEVDDAGSAHLRFGDNALGKAVDPTGSFVATYRIGNGLAGNVGAEAIAHVVLLTSNPGIVGVRNPLPAIGGIDPETVAQVQANAPQAFQQTQLRAVTRPDHVAAALLCPGVINAAAQVRWTGSYYVVSVTVQRAGGAAVDVAFQAQVQTFLEPYRLAGWNIEVKPPTFVSILVGLSVKVAPGFLPTTVLAAVTAALTGPGTTPSGQPAFFSPNNFTFGQTIYFSDVLAVAAAVPGVMWIDTASSATVFTVATAPALFSLPNAFIQLGATQLPLVTLTLSVAGGS
jgi:predicted phage baseplate assembly protein